MAVNTSADKSNTISKLQGLCATILDAIVDAKQLRQEAIDKGYQAGGADPVTDSFLNGASGAFPALAVADLTAAFAAIDAIDTALAANNRTHYKALGKLRP
jgi:hypothetical protein